MSTVLLLELDAVRRTERHFVLLPVAVQIERFDRESHDKFGE